MLSEAQKEEIIAQADSHLKTAKGRGYRRQVTRDEVSEISQVAQSRKPASPKDF